MKTLKVLALLIAVVVATSASKCMAEPEKQAVSTNPDVTVDVMTRFDGITLYRVTGFGKDVFIATRDGSQSIQAHWDQSCGKNCTETISSFTVAPPR